MLTRTTHFSVLQSTYSTTPLTYSLLLLPAFSTTNTTFSSTPKPSPFFPLLQLKHFQLPTTTSSPGCPNTNDHALLCAPTYYNSAPSTPCASSSTTHFSVLQRPHYNQHRTTFLLQLRSTFTTSSTSIRLHHPQAYSPTQPTALAFKKFVLEKPLVTTSTSTPRTALSSCLAYGLDRTQVAKRVPTGLGGTCCAFLSLH